MAEVPQADALLAELRALIQDAQRAATVAVNMSLTMLYWRVGKRIRDVVLGSSAPTTGRRLSPRCRDNWQAHDREGRDRA